MYLTGQAGNPIAAGLALKSFGIAMTWSRWLTVTIVPAMAILIAKPEVGGGRAIFEYLAITHLGGTGVWITLLVLAERGVLGRGTLAGRGALLEAGGGRAAPGGG